MKRERVQFLVNVTICYDETQTAYNDRAIMLANARQDLLMVNTLPNDAKSARLVKKPKS